MTATVPAMIRVAITDARSLVQTCMIRLGYGPIEADIISDHLLDCELRGLGYGGLARALSVAERIAVQGPELPQSIITRETPITAQVDGRGQLGYLAAHRAARLAIDKAQQHGVGIAGLSNSWFTGMFAHYMEMATRAGLFAFATGSSEWRVAPEGATERRFGTNPIAFGFPSLDDPIIIDIGTASMMLSQAGLHGILGEPLPEGIAYAPDGTATRDPVAALAGAVRVWGGAKGSSLAIAVQLMGLLCESPSDPKPPYDNSFFMLAMRPDVLVEIEDFRRRVSDYADRIRSARPLDPNCPPRMPFDRSAAERRARLAQGWIDVPAAVHAKLTAIAQNEVGEKPAST